MSRSQGRNMFKDMQANMPVLPPAAPALLILNMQNDSFDRRYDMTLCENPEFRHTLSNVIPYFRQLGDVVWIKTELDIRPVSSTSEGQSSSSQRSSSDPSSPESLSASPLRIDAETISNYFPSSRAKNVLKRRSSEARLQARTIEASAWEFDEEKEEDVRRSRKSAAAGTIFVPGTPGVELTPDMLANVDLKNDLVLTKHHYSGFDGTPLLMCLRMKLVTHIYLAGCLSNISVYATAADAVRHGFQVTLIEDCLGYRSESKHFESMQKMADGLGVSGVDSKEIIEEVDPMASALPTRAQYAPLGDYRHSPSQDRKDSASPARPSSSSLATATNADTRFRVLPSVSPSQTPMEGVEKHRVSAKQSQALLGPEDHIGEGDSGIVYDALSSLLGHNAFENVYDEVDWQVMRHRNGEVPRRVAVQGETGPNGATPLYRHPADESPPFTDFGPTIKRIRDELQILVKQPFNHCLIQLYRDGQDNISEHSDKTLDIVRGSRIVNLSLGAQRTMTLRSKKVSGVTSTSEAPVARDIQRIPMPHNSVFVLGWRTNARWLHGVRADKRRLEEKTAEEQAFNGQRISLTFRNIGTFTDRDRTKIWGQGAKSKIEAAAGDVITTNNSEMEAMIYAFGDENHQIDFDWDAHYGQGFDVVNTSAQIRIEPYLCLSGDEISNLRVKMAIMHLGISCKFKRAGPTRSNSQEAQSMGSATPTTSSRSTPSILDYENPVFYDSNHVGFVGDASIFDHLYTTYQSEIVFHAPETPGTDVVLANDLLYLWQTLRGQPLTGSTKSSHQSHHLDASNARDYTTTLHLFETELQRWEGIAIRAVNASYEPAFTVPVCACWPVVNDIVRRWQGWSEKRYPNLAGYWKKIGAMISTRKAMMERGEVG